MNYRILGKTSLSVSEIGFGGEWLEKHDFEKSVSLIKYAETKGINIIDCWMNDSKSRAIIGEGIKDNRDKWIVQGHIGSTTKNGQYYRSRELEYVIPAFEDLLKKMQTDYIDIGMIHYVDSKEEWKQIQNSDYLKYVFELKEKGKIKHIGISSHNPEVAIEAAKTDYIEMILFSMNPAFDLFPSGENTIDNMLEDKYEYMLKGIDPLRAELLNLCKENNVGITVMKGFAGGRLFDAKRSPFGVALTPIQCIHYALEKSQIGSILCGYEQKVQIDQAVAYETATDKEKDYASVIANAPLHSYKGQCTYCGHCKPCPKDIDIAMVNKFYDLATAHDDVPQSIKSHYMLLKHHASECIRCKSCESRCPFGVKIADRMKLASNLFEK